MLTTPVKGTSEVPMTCIVLSSDEEPASPLKASKMMGKQSAKDYSGSDNSDSTKTYVDALKSIDSSTVVNPYRDSTTNNPGSSVGPTAASTHGPRHSTHHPNFYNYRYNINTTSKTVASHQGKRRKNTHNKATSTIPPR